MAFKTVRMILKCDLLNAIDDYWYDNRLMNRSQAITEILQIALESENVKKTISDSKNKKKENLK